MTKTTSKDPTDKTTVELLILAHRSQLVILSMLTKTVTTVLNYPTTQIGDVRLAIDHIASSLIPHAVPDSRLHCTLTADDTQLTVQVTTTSSRRQLPDQHSYSWNALRTFTDTITATQKHYNTTASGYPTTITLTYSPETAQDLAEAVRSRAQRTSQPR